MSDTVNNATIMITADASGVEAGLRKVDDATAKTGKNLDNLEASAKKTTAALEGVASTPGMETAGDGAGVAAGRMDRATKSMADSIQRTLATMNAGVKGSAQYYEALANSRGLNVNALRPYLDQLDEMSKKSAIAADAQRKLDDSTKFLDSLRSRTEGIGKSASELAALRAEQLGVSDAAADMIAKLREQEQAGESSFGSLADLAEGAKVAFLAVAAAVAAAAAAGAMMVGDALNDLADLDGMAQKTGSSVESLSKIQKLAVVFGEDMGGVDAAIVKLSRGMAGLDDDSNKVQKALKTLGVASRDAAGNLRDPSVVLVDASKSLQNYRDDAGKTALMNDLLSKSGADLLPFLNDLAENYDGVTGTSGEAAAAAAAFQDQIGFLKIEVKSLATSAAVALAPALRDLAGAFSDVYKQQTSIKKGEWSSWADDLGLGFAKASDAVANFARYSTVAWDAFKAVRSGFMLVDTVGKFDSLTAGYEALNGGDGFKSVKEAFGNLKQAVADGWKSVEEVNGAPSDQFEKAYRARLASRTVPPSPPGAEEGDKPKPGLPNAAAEAAAKEAAKAAAKAAEKAAAEYEALVNRINGKNVGIDADFYSNLNKLYDGYKGGKQSLQDYVDTVETYIGQQQFVKQAEDERLKSLEKYQKALDGASTGADKATKDLQAQRDENDQIGLAKDALGELNATRIEGLALRAEERIWAAEGLDITGALAEEYRKEAAALRERAQAVREGAVKQVGFDAAKKAGEDLDKFLDPTKAQTFGDALKTAFGAAGDSMTQLVGALDAYGIRQAEIDSARKNASVKYATDSKGLADATAAISSKEVKSRLSGYGDMAAAAKGFFSEGSKGYGVLSSVERAYRAAELAMTIQSTAKKIFFKQTEVAANVALNAQKLGVEAATTTASTGLAATEASAWGVTAVVKAMASLPFPMNLAAGAATLAAVVAIGASIMGSVGGSSVPLSQQRQDKQGTGSVLGDSSAKSESISSSIEAIEGATLQGLRISDGMLASLRNIEAGIGQFASFLVQSTGVAGDYGKQFATADGNFLSKIGSSIFGGKKTVEDTGFTLTKASFESILRGGVDASQYADIKKSGGWFSSSKMSSQVEGLGAEGNRQIAGVLTSLYQTVVEASNLIGIGGDDFTAKLSSFVVDIGKVSLKGLTGAEIQEELSAVFSKVGDDLAAFGVDGLGQFQKVGEGYLETLSRVATNYQAVTVVTDSLGMVFDSVGLKSVGARERLIDLLGGLDEFTSGADQFLADFYTSKERADSLRTRITPTLDQFGIKTGAEDALQQFRGVVTGLDLTTEAGARAYATLMQIAPTFKQIADVDKEALEQAADLANGKRELEIQIMEMLGDKAGALAATRAIELAGMDASLRPLRERVYALEDEADALKDEADALATANSLLSIQAQVYELSGDKAGAAAVLALQHVNALAALDPALRGATQNLWDLQAAAKAAEAASKAAEQIKANATSLLSGVDAVFGVLQRVTDRQKKAMQDDIQMRTEAVNNLKSMSSALRSSLDGMRSPEQQEADRYSGMAEVRAALAIAKAGGPLPAADALQKSLSKIGNGPSTAAYATYQDYQRDLFGAQGDLAELAKLTDGALTVEEKNLKVAEDQVKQLDAMLERHQDQIDVLKGISVTGLSIEQAIKALQGAMAAANANPVVSAGAAINNAYQQNLGRAPDAAGFEWWKNAAASGTPIDQIVGGIASSTEADLRKLYQSVLGRAPDAEGLQFWMQAYGPTMSEAEKADWLKAAQKDASNKLPGFAVGTNYVKTDMPAMIHEGERIMPAADNRELMRRLSGPSEGGDALAGEVRRLTGIVERQQAALDRIAESSEEHMKMYQKSTGGGGITYVKVVGAVPA
jgi:hypothetical protein